MAIILTEKKSQDKRIRNTKLEKGKERKIKRKENKKENKEMQFHRKY